MPAINIYLPEELFELVKANKSKIIQQALKEYQQRHTPAAYATPPNPYPSRPASPVPQNNSHPH